MGIPMFTLIVLALVAPGGPGRTAALKPSLAALREKVVAGDSPPRKAAAYEAYFAHVGRVGLRGLAGDDDAGIALQAAWESHLTPIKRDPPFPHAATDVYDPAELRRFVALLQARAKAPVPDWWAAGVTAAEVRPAGSPAFRKAYLTGVGPTAVECVTGHRVPAGAATDARAGMLVYAADGWAVEMPARTFGRLLCGGLAGVVTPGQSAVAGYETGWGTEYVLAGFRGTGGPPAWTAKVWANGQRFGFGGWADHRVEVTAGDGVVCVFGLELSGAYAEGFDAATGKVRFRFCTDYWGWNPDLSAWRQPAGRPNHGGAPDRGGGK
jgi:hypothetical protein